MFFINHTPTTEIYTLSLHDALPIFALISCHRGFHCDPGAEGVGRAAYSAFVNSFVVILMLDFVLGISLDKLYFMLWPDRKSTRLNSSHRCISYAVFCLKKKSAARAI